MNDIDVGAAALETDPAMNTTSDPTKSVLIEKNE